MRVRYNQKKKTFWQVAFFLFLISALFAPKVEAATFLYSPATITTTIGQVSTVQVYVSSSDKSMNAVSGSISFQSDNIEVVNVSKSGSIVNLWVKEPTFSNQNGNISFEGIVLNPGYVGRNGQILSFTFKAKKSGTTSFNFSSGSVLANDGSGTNILNGMSTLSVRVNESDTKSVVTSPSPVVTTPVVPVPEIKIKTIDSTRAENGLEGITITSATNPDQTKWYSLNQPELGWTLPTDVTEIRTAVGVSEQVMPHVIYNPAIQHKTLDKLNDGIYYFALQARNAKGWGVINRYRINIDTVPPKPFKIVFPHGNKGVEPQPVVLFNTTDDGSGIAEYNIAIGKDGGPSKIAPTALSNPYPLPLQKPGEHTIVVTAIDLAGNKSYASSTFEIETVDAPTVTYYPSSMEYGDILKVRGTTYQNSDVYMHIMDSTDDKKYEEYTRSNAYGDFVIVVTKRLKPGKYTFTLDVVDARGAKSLETQPLAVEVTDGDGDGVIGLITKYGPVVAILLVLLALLYILTRLIKSKGRRPLNVTAKQQEVLKHSLKLIKYDIGLHIKQLHVTKTKRKLKKEELNLLKQFEDELVNIDTDLDSID